MMAGLAIILGAMPTVSAAAAAQATSQEQRYFVSAAAEFKVPESLLLAVSYYQSRWEDHEGAMSSDGGYGPMNLREAAVVVDQRGDLQRPIVNKKTEPKGSGTVAQAAKLTGQKADVIKNDAKQNIRGGAAVLADQAKQMYDGKLPADVADWYPVVTAYLGITSEQTVQLTTDSLHQIMTKGQKATTLKGQELELKKVDGLTKPGMDQMRLRMDKTNTPIQAQAATDAECPDTLDCRFIPAGYARNSDDPADFGNYDPANRPDDMKIQYIVIHDTEGSYTSAIQHFQDTTSYTSANYVIRAADGQVTQMVKNSDVAWHAGNWYMNMHSIGIEHEGYAVEGAQWYTEAMYQSSAQLVKYLAQKYEIPVDRDHIIGHDNVPGLNDAAAKSMHWDPGPYWDWSYYMKLIRGGIPEPGANEGEKNAVAIHPNMKENVRSVNTCAYVQNDKQCADHRQAANFVYLRKYPSAKAPLISDKQLDSGWNEWKKKHKHWGWHDNYGRGTTKIDDLTAKATTGQQYVVAETKGDWTAIWFSGQKAWFYNPASAPTAVKTHAMVLKPKAGIDKVTVYGGAFPEASVYPEGVPVPSAKLSYKIGSGQQYVADGPVKTDYFYDATVDYSKPHDHEVFVGQEKYIKLWYNQRTMFVKAADVEVQ